MDTSDVALLLGVPGDWGCAAGERWGDPRLKCRRGIWACVPTALEQRNKRRHDDARKPQRGTLHLNCSVNTNCATEGQGRAFLVAQPDSSGLTAARVHAGRCVAVHTLVLPRYRSSLDAFVGFNLAAPLPLNTVRRASANPSHAGTACCSADMRYSASRSATIPLAMTTLFVPATRSVTRASPPPRRSLSTAGVLA